MWGSAPPLLYARPRPPPLEAVSSRLLISQPLHGWAASVICTYMFQLEPSFKTVRKMVSGVWTAKAHQHSPPPKKKKVKSFSVTTQKPFHYVGRVSWLTDGLFHPRLKLRFVALAAKLLEQLVWGLLYVCEVCFLLHNKLIIFYLSCGCKLQQQLPCKLNCFKEHFHNLEKVIWWQC